MYVISNLIVNSTLYSKELTGYDALQIITSLDAEFFQMISFIVIKRNVAILQIN